MQTWNNWFKTRYEALPIIKERKAKEKYDHRYFIYNNTSYLNFISNDYLGITRHDSLIKALTSASMQYGVGSTGAPTLSGFSVEHSALSTQIASWLGFESCLLFNSGFQLNSSIFYQLTDEDTIIWFDKRCHASHIDGIRLSKAKFYSFNDETLGITFAKINTMPEKRHILLTEGSFSMDGTCQYLERLITFRKSNPHNTMLIIDDAHGIGALGSNGHGTLEQLGLNISHIDLLIGTLGKAFATHGGYICGNNNIISYLEQTVRSVIYSTNTPPAIASSSIASLNLIKSQDGEQLRACLNQNINYFLKLCIKFNLPIYNPTTNISPIQLLIFNDEQTMMKVFDELHNKQILVGKICYPTVKKNAPRIRISITASHTKVNLRILCEALAKALN